MPGQPDITFCDDLIGPVDGMRAMVVVSLDFSKAVTLSHNILTDKLLK